MAIGRTRKRVRMSFRKDNEATKPGSPRSATSVGTDIDYKHQRMKKSAFIFLRATYFRWARKIGDWCPELMDAPQVLSVGDLHLENFGTWRDARRSAGLGRQRFRRSRGDALCARSRAARDQHPAGARSSRASATRRAAEAAAQGLSRRASKKPQPALLFEGETWLRPYAEPRRRQAGEILEGGRINIRKATPPPEIARALIASLPKDVDRRPFACARAAQGRRQPRTAALRRGRLSGAAARCCARPRRWCPRHGSGPTVAKATRKSHFLELANGRYRAPDPFLARAGQTSSSGASPPIPDKIELGADAGSKLQLKLLRAMGFDLASIHAAGSAARQDARPTSKAPRAGSTRREVAAAEVRRDYREWRTAEHR